MVMERTTGETYLRPKLGGHVNSGGQSFLMITGRKTELTFKVLR